MRSQVAFKGEKNRDESAMHRDGKISCLDFVLGLSCLVLSLGSFLSGICVRFRFFQAFSFGSSVRLFLISLFNVLNFLYGLGIKFFAF